MTKKKALGGMAGVALAFALVLSGCATNVATTKSTNFEKKPLGLAGVPNYTVLGTVTLEGSWHGVLGISVLKAPLDALVGDFYLYQTGGVTYRDLLEEAKKTYADADAVIDINIDYNASQYWVFYAKRTNIVSGIAIKYSREEVKSINSGSLNMTVSAQSGK